MRVMTVFGTRPEIIRLSAIIRVIDRYAEHVLVHTGQNYDENLSDVFFRELDVRAPDHHLRVRAAGFADQDGQILAGTDRLMADLKPDRVVILGDTNSGLAAIAAARRGIPVYHLEAGNRCFDDRVPEEINRRLIDHCSTVLMPYTHRSKENLLREGFPRQRIFVVGNPIQEVLTEHEQRIESSAILSTHTLTPNEYFAATLHRAENVDDPARLRSLLEGLRLVAESYRQPVIVSLHPHTADRARHFGIEAGDGVRMVAPLGFWDFVKLERNARCVLSDSGTVQEECCIFRRPSVTIRDTTERAETIECGSAILSGADPDMVLLAVRVATETPCDWSPPSEYLRARVSTAVAKIALGERPTGS